MTRLLLSSTLILSSLSLGACTWVELTNAGEQVRVETAVEVAGCTRIGRANTQVRDRVSVVDRGSRGVQEELTTLARNQAADMGGNVIVVESIINEGQQTFGVYNCPD